MHSPPPSLYNPSSLETLCIYKAASVIGPAEQYKSHLSEYLSDTYSLPVAIAADLSLVGSAEWIRSDCDECKKRRSIEELTYIYWEWKKSETLESMLRGQIKGLFLPHGFIPWLQKKADLVVQGDFIYLFGEISEENLRSNFTKFYLAFKLHLPFGKITDRVEVSGLELRDIEFAKKYGRLYCSDCLIYSKEYVNATENKTFHL